MLARLAILALAVFSMVAYSRHAEGSHPFQGSNQIQNVNFLHRDLEDGGDGQIYYRLCDNAQRGVPSEWQSGVERWDALLGAAFEFDPVTSCSDFKTGATKLRWEVGEECGAGNLACWETWKYPDHYAPHGSHNDTLLGLIIFDKAAWDAVPAWRSYMPAHEFGHDLSLADHVSHDCGENTLMLNYLAGFFPPAPCGDSPTAVDVGSVSCGVYLSCAIRPADFNRDGRADLAVWRPLFAGVDWYIRNVGSFDWGQPGDIPVPADYYGDGTVDIAVWRPSNGTWYIRDTGATFQWGLPGDIPVPASFYGDRDEIAVYRPSNGTWYIQRTGAAIQWGQVGDIPVPASFYGDRDEIAVYRPSNGTWYIQRTGASFQWGLPGDIPVPARYYGDRDEIAVWRPSNGTWYIQRTGAALLWWVSVGDIPVPADYNGDGSADLAVWRPSDGVNGVDDWFIRNVGNFEWGVPSDDPIGTR